MPTANATLADERLSDALLLMSPVTLLAMVISRPSSTQATPRATTSMVWKRDQPSRSSRAGMRLRMTPVSARSAPPSPAAGCSDNPRCTVVTVHPLVVSAEPIPGRSE